MAAIIGLAVSLPALTEAATLAGDYQFQNIFDSSVGTIGPLTVVGPAGGATFVDDTVNGQTQRVLNIRANSDSGMPPTFTETGVQAQTNGFLSSTNFSIVLFAKFQFSMTDPVATKIFDFKNLSSDDGLYINPAGFLAFNGVTPLPIGGSPVAPDTYARVVLTRDGSTGITTVYQNGVQAFQFTDSADQAVLGDTMSGSPNSFLTLFKDDGTGLGGALTEESTLGNIARLQLYDGPLSPEEVAALEVPEPGTWALLAIGLGALVFRFRRARSEA